MILADLHMHSTFSDGKLTIPQLVDLYGQQGFGAIAITDHLCETTTVIGKAAGLLGHTLTRESFPRYLEIIQEESERAWRLYRMILIPGFELTKNSVFNHRSAHILGLSMTNYIPAEGEVKDLARAVRAQGGVAVAAHPVSTRKFEKQTYQLWDQRFELEHEFDAWEVASGPYLFHEVLRSSVPKVASSDLHHPNQMSSWKTVFSCEKSIPAILNAIRKQELEFKFYDAKLPFDAREILSATVPAKRFLLNPGLKAQALEG